MTVGSDHSAPGPSDLPATGATDESLEPRSHDRIERSDAGGTVTVRDERSAADACAAQRRRSCWSRGDTRPLVPVLLHGKVFAYYGGTVSIGVDVDDETDWVQSTSCWTRSMCRQLRERNTRSASQTARWRETATERAR